MADNVRSIPSAADGLKPGQRKVIWACFKRKLKKEIKVIPTLSHRRSQRLFIYHPGRATRRIYLRTCGVSPRRAESDDDDRQSRAGLRREQ
jgi:hypothetical protein